MSGQAVGLGERQLELVVEHLLAGGNGGRRLRGDESRERLDLGIERLRKHDAIDESDLPGAFGIDRLAGEQHLHGVLAADRPAERDTGRGTERTNVHAGRRERRRGGRHREIAGGDELTPRRGRQAVHLGDDRLRQPRDRHHHPAAARKERLDVVDVVHRPDLLEIVAGAEAAPRAANTTTRTPGSDPIRSSADCSSSMSARERALNWPGRFRVIVAMPSCDSTSSTPSVCGRGSRRRVHIKPFCVLTSERETRAESDGARGPGARDLRGDRDARSR